MLNYQTIRRITAPVTVGTVGIGGTHPLAIQSMTNTDPHDPVATAEQILRLQAAGCDIVRITVPDLEAAEMLPRLKAAGITIPIVADIHFDYRIALRCAELGVDKIRINPGNIGDEERVHQVAEACRARRIPIRIGVNSGSLERHLLDKHGGPTAAALCESALYHCALLEKFNFEDIVISIKASDVATMVEANRRLAAACSYPLHLGVTEAGGGEMGLVKSAMGIGALLLDGIGDTLRVSLTADPVAEIAAARRILDGLSIEGQRGMNIVSCPTCGRTRIDLIALSEQFRVAVAKEGLDRLPVTVALMGCAVNGPGEAKEADIGIAGGMREGLLFRHGQVVEKLPEEELIPRLIRELQAMAE